MRIPSTSGIIVIYGESNTVRTTHLQRTIESMTQVFRGLYPEEEARTVPSFHVRLANQENLYPNDEFCAYPTPAILI